MASFPKKIDKVISGPNKEVEYKVLFTIPVAAAYKGYKISVGLDGQKTNLPLDSILLPGNNIITIDKQTEDGIKIKLKRDFLMIRTLLLSLQLQMGQEWTRVLC